MTTSKVLTENSKTTQVEAIARSGEYEYQVTYSYDGNELHRLTCNINKVEVNEQRNYAGYMSFENGNKSMNFPANVEIAPHIVMFEAILTEVKAGLPA
ncbi:hypothetical protein [Bacteroides sp.]|uniref:hypothetical protein n=1 Tax=Bacteroides sp. TaxID=29523 RepID=UPI00263331CA|nr:hypothetical protein [Bacteroides sp.]MDD3038601.1 hypothetical protein [Bacteroides sp.]